MVYDLCSFRYADNLITTRSQAAIHTSKRVSRFSGFHTTFEIVLLYIPHIRMRAMRVVYNYHFMDKIKYYLT